MPSQHVPLQHITAQHLSTQHAQTQHVPAHVHNQQTTIPIAVIGGPGQGGTAYSTYDAASQSTVGVPAGWILLHYIRPFLSIFIDLVVHFCLNSRITLVFIRTNGCAIA